MKYIIAILDVILAIAYFIKPELTDLTISLIFLQLSGLYLTKKDN